MPRRLIIRAKNLIARANRQKTAAEPRQGTRFVLGCYTQEIFESALSGQPAWRRYRARRRKARHAVKPAMTATPVSPSRAPPTIVATRRGGVISAAPARRYRWAR